MVFISELRVAASVFAPQISVCRRAPLLCRIIVFAIGPALISWHYRPRFDDAAVPPCGRSRWPGMSESTCGILEKPRRCSIHRPYDFSGGSRWSTRGHEISSNRSGMPDHSGSDFPNSISGAIPTSGRSHVATPRRDKYLSRSRPHKTRSIKKCIYYRESALQQEACSSCRRRTIGRSYVRVRSPYGIILSRVISQCDDSVKIARTGRTIDRSRCFATWEIPTHLGAYF